MWEYSSDSKVPMDEEMQIPKVCAQLVRHKAEFRVVEPGSDGQEPGVEFFPSPHLTEEQIQEGTEDFDTTDVGASLVIAAALEAAGAKAETVVSQSDPQAKVVELASTSNQFLRTIELAWFEHHALRLRPDHIWLIVLQSVAIHIKLNAEAVRHLFVPFDGKRELVSLRPDIDLNDPSSDWPSLVSDFSALISANCTNDSASLFQAAFSTTTPLDATISAVTTMGALDQYFTYRGGVGCGFPKITLEGTKEDWVRLEEKVRDLLTELETVDEYPRKLPKSEAVYTGKYKDEGKGWRHPEKPVTTEWKEALLPVLDRFVAAFDGEIDSLFWNSMLRRGGTYLSSGLPYIDPVPAGSKGSTRGHYCGWINVFYPYTSSRGSTAWERNVFCLPYTPLREYTVHEFGLWHGPKVLSFPAGYTAVPVILDNHAVVPAETIDTKLTAGFFGIKQSKLCDGTVELTPHTGWVLAKVA